MHPILLEYAGFRLETYTVIGIFALLVFMIWTRRRAVSMGMRAEDAEKILIWVYVCGLLGAVAGDVIEKSAYSVSLPTISQIITNSGATSGAGLLVGGVTGVLLMRRYKVSIGAGLDAAAVPLAFMFSIARIGCWFAGCCRGIGTAHGAGVWWMCRFPNDPEYLYRCPTQLMESLAAAIIGLILMTIENEISLRGSETDKPRVLFPIFIVLYGTYRMVFDGLREPEPSAAFRMAPVIAPAAVAASVLWLWWIWKKR
ncbi:MAG: prolipoprotein diacylglyceryl transferase [Synergistaceae bacterium]|nr:prolipoprotein diacylglyceryl transferase [Synergistaceae bacterium]